MTLIKTITFIVIGITVIAGVIYITHKYKKGGYDA